MIWWFNVPPATTMETNQFPVSGEQVMVSFLIYQITIAMASPLVAPFYLRRLQLKKLGNEVGLPFCYWIMTKEGFQSHLKFQLNCSIVDSAGIARLYCSTKFGKVMETVAIQLSKRSQLKFKRKYLYTVVFLHHSKLLRQGKNWFVLGG